MTILAMTDGQGGLEVLLPNSNWSSVLAGPGELVVNLGDMMARWTNGRWASTVHRVVNPPVINLAKSRRQSIGYFMHPERRHSDHLHSHLSPGGAPRRAFRTPPPAAISGPRSRQSHKAA